MNYEEMQGKTAIVTGGALGIGRATAVAFAQQGVNVVIADIQEEKAQDTLNLIKDKPGEGHFIKTDVSSLQDIKDMVQETLDKFGSLDYAFNNAGIEGKQTPLAEQSEEDWDKIISINLKGVWTCMKCEIKEMLKAEAGVIVNMSSVAGKVGFANLAPYVATKHGVNGLTKTAALEYAKKGLRINSVCPGVIKTEMIERITKKDKEAEKQFANLAPVGRMGKPEEIAEAVLWLCSEESSFVTGHTLVVDGGFLAK
jgi:NAD(P)-dependent dehydrogenase (short-subunit alcohol dehydrogenase family)